MTINLRKKYSLTTLAFALVATSLFGGAAHAATKPTTTKPVTKPVTTKPVTTKPVTTPTPVPTPVVTQAPVSNSFSIALIGDMPYDALGVTQVPNVINEINASKVDFTLFGGDTMSGKGDKCTDEAYPALKTNFFNKFGKQIFYTVGDNEWVDCDRPVKGAYDPTILRLA